MALRVTIFIGLVVLAGFIACKTKPATTQQKQDSASNPIPKPIEKPTKAAQEPAAVSYHYPSDSVTYTAKILTPGGVFHDGEVDPKSESYSWKGLFKTDTGFYITNTRLKLSRDTDLILDNDNEKTGWVVTPSMQDTAVLLMAGANDLVNGPVLPVSLKKNTLLPGEHLKLVYHGITYTLYATGNKKAEVPGSKNCVVTNYRLFIKATVDGKNYNQLLAGTNLCDEAMMQILFAGDMDGDQVPDFIIDTTYHYNLSSPTLYLSKPAGKAQLLKVMGMHSITGC